MARLPASRGGARLRSRGGDWRKCSICCIGSRRLSEAPISERDNLYVDTDARAPAEPPDQARGVVRPGRSRRLGGAPRRSRPRPRPVAHAQGQRLQVRQTRDRGRRCWPRATRCLPRLQQFKKDADADLAACLQQELAGATARYQELKAAAGALDFADLLANARDLIKSNETVRRHLQAQVHAHLRRRIPGHRSDSGRDLCCSLAGGRPGQALHRRRSEAGDLPLSRNRRRHVLARARPARPQGGRTLQLTTSYRSVPSIQQFVNAAFERHMVENPATLQAGYVPLAQDPATTIPSQPADRSRCRCRSRTAGGASGR